MSKNQYTKCCGYNPCNCNHQAPSHGPFNLGIPFPIPQAPAAGDDPVTGDDSEMEEVANPNAILATTTIPCPGGTGALQVSGASGFLQAGQVLTFPVGSVRITGITGDAIYFTNADVPCDTNLLSGTEFTVSTPPPLAVLEGVLRQWFCDADQNCTTCGDVSSLSCINSFAICGRREGDTEDSIFAVTPTQWAAYLASDKFSDDAGSFAEQILNRFYVENGEPGEGCYLVCYDEEGNPVLTNIQDEIDKLSQEWILENCDLILGNGFGDDGNDRVNISGDFIYAPTTAPPAGATHGVFTIAVGSRRNSNTFFRIRDANGKIQYRHYQDSDDDSGAETHTFKLPLGYNGNSNAFFFGFEESEVGIIIHEGYCKTNII